MSDRKKYIDILRKTVKTVKQFNEDAPIKISLECVEDILELLKEQERKKGSWDYGTQCSVCKGTIIPPKDRKVRVNFCPWCGADMRDSYDSEGR